MRMGRNLARCCRSRGDHFAIQFQARLEARTLHNTLKPAGAKDGQLIYKMPGGRTDTLPLKYCVSLRKNVQLPWGPAPSLASSNHVNSRGLFYKFCALLAGFTFFLQLPVCTRPFCLIIP